MRLISRFLVLIIIVLAVYTFQRSYVMRMGYELESLKKEKKHLEQIHNSLLIEKAALTSMERIEKIATSYLEMKMPADNQIVLVMDEESNKAATAQAKADTQENVTLSQVKMDKYSKQ
ncbi:MAG: cell division protein FtsL [Nitrospirae bacterium]|nr:cell division protein FtsL [Nitrospirota bacterium]